MVTDTVRPGIYRKVSCFLKRVHHDRDGVICTPELCAEDLQSPAWDTLPSGLICIQYNTCQGVWQALKRLRQAEHY
ncbi:MAG: hypothetical protein SPK62_11305, partial [Gemmiger sp.]|nr:hypothetical protein [Gemmiger sp.]